MGSSERLHLRWNDFESNIKLGFSELRKDEELYDVTIACGSKQLKAHKVILSACSPFFRSVIKSIPHAHPFLYLRGIKFNQLESLLCFMYNGEVSVAQDELNSFLSVAKDLQIKGLTQNDSKNPSPMKDGPPNKRSRVLNNDVIEQPEPIAPSTQTITIAEDEDIQDVTPIKSEHEQKFICPEDSIGLDNESQNFEEDFHEEKYITDDQYASESAEIDYINNESTLEEGVPGSSRPSHSLKENEEPGVQNPLNVHFPERIPATRFKARPSKRCVQCSKKLNENGKKIRRETTWRCSGCKVSLCVVCFMPYHCVSTY